MARKYPALDVHYGVARKTTCTIRTTYYCGHEVTVKATGNRQDQALRAAHAKLMDAIEKEGRKCRAAGLM